MDILFDSNSLQTQAHNKGIGLQQEGERLNDLLEALRNEGTGAVTFSAEDEELSENELADADVLVIPTRPPASGGPYEKPFSYSEIQRIVEFVNTGGGLFLLSNHEDFTSEDHRLAEHFGVEILDQSVCYDSEDRVQLNERHLHDHAITGGDGSEGRAVHEIEVDNCGKLLAQDGDVEPVVDLGDYADAYFCLATEAEEGRVVVVADSGLLGSEKSLIPGPGLFHEADNRAFVLNSLEWAAGELESG